MTITMHDTQAYSIVELRLLLASLNGQTFKADSKAEAYDWIEGQLKSYRYDHLGKTERGVVRQYLRTYTGYSVSQLSRLMSGWHKSPTVRLKTDRRAQFAQRVNP